MVTRRLAVIGWVLVAGITGESRAAGPIVQGSWRPVRITRRAEYRAVVPPSGPASSDPIMNRPFAGTETKGSRFLGPWQDGGGEVWREYDLYSYTRQIGGNPRPQLGVVDWILRLTGSEAWHGEQVAVLSAGRNRLRVYQNAELQRQVGQIVDRFTHPAADQLGFRVKVVTVADPGWRENTHPLMQPVGATSNGGQVWTLEPEDASLLQATLQRDPHYRLHAVPHILAYNGQPATVKATSKVSYLRGVQLVPGGWPGFQPVLGELEEGLTVDLNALVTADGKELDAVLGLRMDRLEKLHDVTLASLPGSTLDKSKAQVPQVASCQFSQWVHWRADKVLLISLGMQRPIAAGRGMLGFGDGPDTVEALVLVEAQPLDRGPAVPAPVQPLTLSQRAGWFWRR